MVWRQSVPLVTVCAEVRETHGELPPDAVQLKKWYLTRTLEAPIGPFPVASAFLACLGNH